MADNITILDSTGATATVATKDLNGAEYQTVIPAFGATPTLVDASNGLPVAQATAANLNAQVQGSAASGATKSGNPVQLGGVFNTTKPTVTTGQAVELQATSRGSLFATLSDASGNNIGNFETTDADAESVKSTASVLPVESYPRVFNGSTWDRLRGDTSGIWSQIKTGQAAHAASISGNPVRIGLRAQTSDITAVSAGQTTDAVASILGKQVTLSNALPGQRWFATGELTSATAVTLKAAAGVGVKIYVDYVKVINSHQTTATRVQINDGAAGTAIWKSFCQFAGGGEAGAVSPFSGTANTLLEIKEETATATNGVVYYVSGYTSVE